MKTNKLNALRSIAIIALVAVIGFSMVACPTGGNNPDDGDKDKDKDKNKKGLTAKYRVTGESYGANASGRSVARSAVSRAIDTASLPQPLQDIVAFYDELGTLKGVFTPDKFEIGMDGIVILSETYDPEENIIDQYLLAYIVELGNHLCFDLANPIDLEIDTEDIVTGVPYEKMYVYYNLQSWGVTELPDGSYTNGPDTKITFRMPEGYNVENSIYNSSDGGSWLTPDTITEEDGNLVMKVRYLEPNMAAVVFDAKYASQGNMLATYFGNTFTGNTTTYNVESYYYTITKPFPALTFPEDGDIRLDIVWDIEGLIEWYEGKTDSPDDDIFIFRRGYWDEFSVNIIVDPLDETSALKSEVYGKWRNMYAIAGENSDISFTYGKSNGTPSYNTFSINGSLGAYDYASLIGEPTPYTLRAMKSMDHFTFQIIGDGNSYDVMIRTTDTLENGHNHYRKTFSTTAGQTATITVNISDLVQADWGEPPEPIDPEELEEGEEQPVNWIVDFTQANVEGIQIQRTDEGTFNLTVWNIRLFQ
jgi:hypothetical protein